MQRLFGLDCHWSLENFIIKYLCLKIKSAWIIHTYCYKFSIFNFFRTPTFLDPILDDFLSQTDQKATSKVILKTSDSNFISLM